MLQTGQISYRAGWTAAGNAVEAIGGDLVLGFFRGTKDLQFGGRSKKCVFKPLYFWLVPFKYFQCLNK